MSKYTQHAIEQAFMSLVEAKAFDKITVTEIIETADVNRNTFYYHYQDIYDLLDRICKKAVEQYRRETSADRSFFAACKRAADFLQDRRAVVLHLYDSTAKNILLVFLMKCTLNFVRRFVEADAVGTDLSKDGKEFITAFYSHSLIGLTVRWIDCDMPTYRDLVIETFAQSYAATIDEMIEVYRNRYSRYGQMRSVLSSWEDDENNIGA